MAPVMMELQSHSVPFRYMDSGEDGELTRVLARSLAPNRIACGYETQERNWKVRI